MRESEKNNIKTLGTTNKTYFNKNQKTIWTFFKCQSKWPMKIKSTFTLNQRENDNLLYRIDNVGLTWNLGVGEAVSDWVSGESICAEHSNEERNRGTCKQKETIISNFPFLQSKRNNFN